MGELRARGFRRLHPQPPPRRSASGNWRPRGWLPSGWRWEGFAAGFLSGILGGLILGIILAVALPLLAPLLPSLVPILTWLQVGALLIPVILSLKGEVLSAIDGLLWGIIASKH